MLPSSMKPTHISSRTSRGTSDRTPTLRQAIFFDQPYPDNKCESKNQNPSTEKASLPKSSQQNARKSRVGKDDENELIKYMSNLPCFLQQQMEKESTIQDNALNFGVLDWKRLEKWKYTERMPVKYPPHKKQSSPHVRIPKSGKIPGGHSLRFGTPQQRYNEEHHKEDTYTELIKSNKVREAHGREYQYAESIESVRRKDHFHQSVKRKDPKIELIVEKEASPNHMAPENTVSLKSKQLPKHRSESSQFMESMTSLSGQQAKMTGNRLSDFLSPQVLKSGELSTDKKQPEIYEHLTTPKERPSSPMRRLSFDLGKMSRSLSYKDNSAVPQLNSGYTSVKSGPAIPELIPSMDKFKKTDQANASVRARSSPLRRLLDPLLKHKGPYAETASSAGTKGPETATSAGTKVPETAYITRTKAPETPHIAVPKGLSQDRKPGGSTLQALLQLTLNNGLPFLKLVVNNSNDMLAADVKSLPGNGKIDTDMIYVFYSVHEMKKKSMSWINQGAKVKSCGLGYNIVGEMKISGSSDCESRECVLYGVDPGQLENQTHDYVPNKEVAAVIIPNTERRFLHCVSKENKKSRGTTVILPDGVHGVPNEGEPSSLVSRFGGSCDCGGWDVSCKLRVLAGDKKGTNSLQESMLGSTNDHISLYLEGVKKGNKPVFSLKPFSNGYYSIELDASISLLQAFATCVAYVTCMEFPEITGTKSLPKKEHLSEPTITGRKTATTFQEQLPAYVICPPLSPVGRS